MVFSTHNMHVQMTECLNLMLHVGTALMTGQRFADAFLHRKTEERLGGDRGKDKRMKTEGKVGEAEAVDVEKQSVAQRAYGTTMAYLAQHQVSDVILIF